MADQVLPPVVPRRCSFSWSTVLLWIILAPVGLTVVVHVWYMVSKAFTPGINQLKWPIVWVPDPFTVDNFRHIFADRTLPIMRWMANSFLVTGVGTTLVLFLSALSAYGFARLQFPGRDLIFFLLLISMMVPGVATLIPTFLLLRDLKLLDNYFSLWLPGAASVGAIFFLRQQFFAIPHELEAAATIDGPGRFRPFWHVSLPLVQSALIAQGILTAMAFWNDLYWPLFPLITRELLTLPVGRVALSQGRHL